MSNEVRIGASLFVKLGNLEYQNRRTSFNGILDTPMGPSPGAIVVSTAGTNVNFSQLTKPGYAIIENLDDTNYVEFGTHDGLIFHPLGEVLPGECYPIRFSRNLGVEEDIPGTGTTGVVNNFCLRANTAACNVVVSAFEAN